MRDAVLDVRDFLDRRAIAGTQWLILVLCFLVMVTDGFHTAVIAFVAPVVAQ